MKGGEVVKLIEDFIDESEVVSERRVRARSDVKRFRDALQELSDHGIQHITTITGTDMGKEIELTYHISCGNGTLLDLSITIPRDERKVPTVTDIFPGALLYERELMDLLGVRVQDHPDPRRLLLPDDWPKGRYPLLRKEIDYKELSNLTISKIKKVSKKIDLNYEKLLEAEKKNKNRKTLKNWLKKRIEKSGGEKE